jgi:hypothetical protein
LKNGLEILKKNYFIGVGVAGPVFKDTNDLSRLIFMFLNVTVCRYGI